ncbi:hypothetical protein Tco_0632399 [Tanacetum coccineum]
MNQWTSLSLFLNTLLMSIDTLHLLQPPTHCTSHPLEFLNAHGTSVATTCSRTSQDYDTEVRQVRGGRPCLARSTRRAEKGVGQYGL